jgi:hypothetical protein
MPAQVEVFRLFIHLRVTPAQAEVSRLRTMMVKKECISVKNRWEAVESSIPLVKIGYIIREIPACAGMTMVGDAFVH